MGKQDKRHNARWGAATVALAVLAGVYFAWGREALAGMRAPDTDTIVMHRREDIPENFRAIDSSIALLKDGDLMLRTGADAISFMLLQMNRTNKTYSHCGIVMVEDGYPFVYHSIGGEDNPGERLCRDSATHFLDPRSNQRLGIARLDLTANHIARLHNIVQRYYRQGSKFDMDFDLATDDKLYCAEFVYKAVRETTGDTAYFPRTETLGRIYVGADNLYENPHAKIICDYQYK